MAQAKARPSTPRAKSAEVPLAAPAGAAARIQGAGLGRQHRLVKLDDVGRLTTILVSDAVQAMTGDTLYVDGGFHIVG